MRRRRAASPRPRGRARRRAVARPRAARRARCAGARARMGSPAAVSAARHGERGRRAAGPADAPEAGPPGPSLPAGVTTSMSSAAAPATACASGPSANAANGSTTPISATRAASCVSPLPFGSTAPRGRRSPGRCGRTRRRRPQCRAATRPRAPAAPGAGRDAVQPSRATVADDDPGELGPVPLGPSGDRGVRPRRRVAARVDDVDAAQQAALRYGCVRSTPVSSSATVIPDPSKPGRGRADPLQARGSRDVRGGRARPQSDTRRAPGRRPRRADRAPAAATACGRAAPRSR